MIKVILAVVLLAGVMYAQTGSNGYPTKELSGVPNCPDSGGNHLNATSGTTFVCGTSNSGSAGGTAAQFSTTAVTATNPSAEATLMELALPAGYLNVLNQPYVAHASGTYNTGAAKTPTLTYKAKLCTVSGCGSGIVVQLLANGGIVTTATVAAVANNSWNINLKLAPNVIGASGTIVTHGPLNIDLGALTTTADSTFNDLNTGPSSAIDLTAALFLDFSVQMSSSNASNQVIQQLGGVSPDSTTVSIASGTTGNNAKYTSATTVGDGGSVAANLVVAASPGVGIAHFAGSTQTLTSSAVNLANADVTGVLPGANGGSAGCTASCSFVVGDKRIPGSVGNTGAALGNTALNTHWARFHLDVTTKFGTTCLAGVQTLAAALHFHAGLFSITGSTLTPVWDCGQMSTASVGQVANTSVTAYTAAPGDYYIGFCADTTTTFVPYSLFSATAVANTASAIFSGGGSQLAHNFGVDTTAGLADQCSTAAAALPTGPTIANINFTPGTTLVQVPLLVSVNP